MGEQYFSDTHCCHRSIMSSAKSTSNLHGSCGLPICGSFWKMMDENVTTGREGKAKREKSSNVSGWP